MKLVWSLILGLGIGLWFIIAALLLGSGGSRNLLAARGGDRHPGCLAR